MADHSVSSCSVGDQDILVVTTVGVHHLPPSTRWWATASPPPTTPPPGTANINVMDTCTFQYNYSYGNSGGFYLNCISNCAGGATTANVIHRYKRHLRVQFVSVLEDCDSAFHEWAEPDCCVVFAELLTRVASGSSVDVPSSAYHQWHIGAYNCGPPTVVRVDAPARVFATGKAFL